MKLRNFIILIFFLLSPLILNAQYQKLSINDIKKEIRSIDFKLKNYNKIEKITPDNIIMIEGFFDNFKLMKIKVTIESFSVKILEEYYFKDEILIYANIEEYKFNILLKESAIYYKNYNYLTFYINNKKTIYDYKSYFAKKDKIKEDIVIYLKFLFDKI